MLARETRTADAMPTIRKVVGLVGTKYPKARWAVSAPLDDVYVMLHLYLDIDNAWRIDDLTRPILNNGGQNGPLILVLVHPAMEADLPEVFTAPAVSTECPPT